MSEALETMEATSPPAETGGPSRAKHGSLRELLVLAWPLILSNSFWTIQLFLDAVFLNWYDTRSPGAVMAAGVLFWTCFVLLQTTTNYATTFIAQYIGAGRPERVGPVIWQSLRFAILAGVAFMGLSPLADSLFALMGHAPELQVMEATYFSYMAFCALPMLIIAACNSFFACLRESRVVILVDATGTVVNVVLGYALIFGALGLPNMGIAGAGLALIVGSWVAALMSFGLMMRTKYRLEFATLTGWRFDPVLFKRLMRFGLPNGLQWTLDATAFTAFIIILGQYGSAELAATGIASRINMLAFLPMLGVGQAVAILVGQRLGENKPDLAERSARTGLRVAAIYMSTISVLYVLTPSVFIAPFRPNSDLEHWNTIAEMVRLLLWFVAVYSLFSSFEVVYTFALRGAGDTVFVTWVSLALAWPVMVFPTWLAWQFHWGLYWSWGFASTYVIVMSLVFMLRFRHGKWKSMRVIEQAPVVE